jgi:hypothetical protein
MAVNSQTRKQSTMKRRFEFVYADFRANERAWSRAPESRLRNRAVEGSFADRSSVLHAEMIGAEITNSADARAALAYAARNPEDRALPSILRRVQAAL